jgi:hypothetical protein
MHLSDIHLPEGVDITTLMHDENNEHDYAVVSVLPPRIEVEPEDEDDALAVESDEQADDDTESSDSSEEQQES